jgi:hypothetical protein
MDSRYYEKVVDVLLYILNKTPLRWMSKDDMFKWFERANIYSMNKYQISLLRTSPWYDLPLAKRKACMKKDMPEVIRKEVSIISNTLNVLPAALAYGKAAIEVIHPVHEPWKIPVVIANRECDLGQLSASDREALDSVKPNFRLPSIFR